MRLIERIKDLLKRSKEEEIVTVEEEPQVEDELEELVERARRVQVEREETSSDPWSDFKAICKEIGSDYKEVITKAAWYYIEETGGVDVDDPISQTREIAEALEKLDDATKRLSEPESVKKLKAYREALQEVAEFKEVVREIKGEKLTAKDLLPVILRMMK